MKQFLILQFILWGVSLSLLGQNVPNHDSGRHIIPIPLEVFPADKGVLMQMVVTKKLAPDTRWGIFALSEYYGDYDREMPMDEFIAQTYLTYDVLPGLSVTGGTAINHVSGFSPSLGLQLAMPFKDFFFLIVPRVELIGNNNAELLGFVEYKPMFNEKWGLYSRVQALYAQNLQAKAHEISYLRLRLGASYKGFQFGLGTNHVNYGPMKFHKDFYGVFLRASLF